MKIMKLFYILRLSFLSVCVCRFGSVAKKKYFETRMDG